MTVVDSTSFLDEVRVADYLEDRGMEAQEGDTRTIADLLVTQASKEKAPAVRRASTAGGLGCLVVVAGSRAARSPLVWRAPLSIVS